MSLTLEEQFALLDLESKEMNETDSTDGIRKTISKHLSKFACTARQEEKEISGTNGKSMQSSGTNGRSGESSGTNGRSGRTTSESSHDFTEHKTTFVHPPPSAPSHAPSSVDQDDDVYSFTYKRRGLAIIINNEDFTLAKDFGDRPGSTHDARALHTSLTALGFDVLLYNNLSAFKMVHVLKTVAGQYDHRNADCLVCSILTHGDQTWFDKEVGRQTMTVRQDVLFGVDGKSIATKVVVDIFSDIHCPSLIGKPRLFFLQACRGNKLDHGQKVLVSKKAVKRISPRKLFGKDAGDGKTETDSLDKPSYDRSGSLSSSVDPPKFAGEVDFLDAGVEPEDEETEKLAPPETSDNPDALWSPISDKPVSPAPLYKDCLIMYATPPGHFAWRRTSGAWFIQSLCRVFSMPNLGNKPLLNSLVLVSGLVARHYQSENPSNPQMHQKKEVPVIESKLVKDIFMTKKVRAA